MSQTLADPRRELGQYYTPSSLAASIAGGCLRRFWQEHPRESPRVLDPACGDGAFLIEVLRLLVERHPRTDADGRLRALEHGVFGVDRDAAAVGVARQRLLELIDPPQRLIRRTRFILQSNVRVGCALTGTGFACTNDRSTDGSADPALVDWAASFPQVARRGGFDCIVGNPPYRRELNAQPLFERLARSPLGRWRDPRMDLWYYFLHRGLDLLRPGGWLSFIVSSYWTASRGARRLIARLQQETTLEAIMLLGRQRVFSDVSGRHLIFRLRKGHWNNYCVVTDASTEFQHQESSIGIPPVRERSALAANTEYSVLGTQYSGLITQSANLTQTLDPQPSTHQIYEIPQAALYGDGRLLTMPPCLLDQLAGSARLGDHFEVRQGIAENPPWITARLNRHYDNRFQTGAGVFVLTDEERDALDLSPSEQQLLRPYFAVGSVGRFQCPRAPTHWLLYLTPQTAPSLEEFPQVKRHLRHYRAILEARREVRSGRLAWWQLHWPREERLFTQPRILSVQMGRVPQFVWAEQPTFVGFSVNVVLSRTANQFSLPVLTALLNSRLAREWFERHAKRRGVHLEINGAVLRQFPLPDRHSQIERELTHITCNAQQGAFHDERLDERVERLYFSSLRRGRK